MNLIIEMIEFNHESFSSDSSVHNITIDYSINMAAHFVKFDASIASFGWGFLVIDIRDPTFIIRPYYLFLKTTKWQDVFALNT